jgi:hypothetical protein
MKNKFNKFSVPLGLLDYINPICYMITMIVILKRLSKVIETPYVVLFIGAVISIIFGFVIPTLKVLIGLKKIKFKMPVNLVFIVNSGILLSGLMILRYVFGIQLLLLLILFIILSLLSIVYIKTKKFNTVAVLTGAFGYLMIYISLITLSIRYHLVLPIIMYAVAIILFLFLCGIGIKANLKNPKVHWIIESCNILCQLLVAIGTIILFN